MIICGTGHRPNKLGGYGPEAEAVVYETAKQWLLDNMPDKVISGMAMGWDMALARAAISLEIPLIAAVPFKGQESRWSYQTVNLYHKLLSEADEVVYVCDEGYAAWKMQVRNEWMVNHADLVLALWDGSSGGTGNCIAYAEKVGKPIHNTWDLYQQVREAPF